MRKYGFLAAFAVVGGLVACTTTTTNVVGGSDAGTEDTEDGSVPGDGGGAPAPEPPHAEGVIVLGESHTPAGGSPTPLVSVAFYPNMKAKARARGCIDTVGSCELVRTPKCTEADTFSGCESGSACVFDDGCAPVCKKLCAKSCEEGQVCELDKLEAESCVDIETFDGGPISFTGTSAAISLFPPSYTYESEERGAPFTPGAALGVKGQGAAQAGFEAFDVKGEATSFIQTSPSLDKISKVEAFGEGPMPVSWVPGKDTVQITVSSGEGSATCRAEDAKGSFAVPREVIDAVVGTKGVPLTVSVSRVREDIAKGLKTKGTLRSETIEPEGWVRVTTMSTETTSIQGCGAGAKVCGDECINVSSDPNNCGGCGKTCNTGECVASKCLDCDGCLAKVQAAGGACAAAYSACLANATCKSLDACVQACAANDQACNTKCRTDYAAGEPLLNTFVSCLATNCRVDCQL